MRETEVFTVMADGVRFVPTVHGFVFAVGAREGDGRFYAGVEVGEG